MEYFTEIPDAFAIIHGDPKDTDLLFLLRKDFRDVTRRIESREAQNRPVPHHLVIQRQTLKTKILQAEAA